ncbi:MAG: hypothetical protein MUF68_08280 [Cyclobacteriaceae bacterium]|nr:hypothetical protein [Cyclobacteriaceae bacterium]
MLFIYGVGVPSTQSSHLYPLNGTAWAVAVRDLMALSESVHTLYLIFVE